MAKLFISFYDEYSENESKVFEHVEAPRELRFGTGLHGGYKSAHIPLYANRIQSQRRFERLLSAHVVIHDEYYRRVWEGKVEDSELTNVGVNLTAEGYFSHAVEALHGLIYPESTGTYAHDILIDTINLAAQSFGTSRTWSGADALIERTDIDLEPLDFSGEAKLIDAIEEVMKYGYKELDWRPVYFAIYNYRVARFFPEPELPPTYEHDIKWFIPRGALSYGGSWSAAQTRSSLWNKVWYMWDNEEQDSVGPTLSASADEDLVSQKIYGIRETVINTGQVADESQAQVIQDVIISRSPYPTQSFEGSITGRIRHLAGMQDEPYMIKAGDVIVMEDLNLNAPVSSLVTGAKAASAAGFVTGTEYNYARNTLTIDVGTNAKVLETVLARWGMSGGLA